MTTRERILAIRLMNQMEKSNVCTKDENGVLKLHDKDGNVLVEARMIKRSY